ncbi:hypothetical protein Tco_0449478 [Tanacetum coccineum]
MGGFVRVSGCSKSHWILRGVCAVGMLRKLSDWRGRVARGGEEVEEGEGGGRLRGCDMWGVEASGTSESRSTGVGALVFGVHGCGRYYMRSGSSGRRGEYRGVVLELDGMRGIMRVLLHTTAGGHWVYERVNEQIVSASGHRLLGLTCQSIGSADSKDDGGQGSGRLGDIGSTVQDAICGLIAGGARRDVLTRKKQDKLVCSLPRSASQKEMGASIGNAAQGDSLADETRQGVVCHIGGRDIYMRVLAEDMAPSRSECGGMFITVKRDERALASTREGFYIEIAGYIVDKTECRLHSGRPQALAPSGACLRTRGRQSRLVGDDD